MRVQAWHIIVLIVVILIVFGSKRLPDIARSIGQSMKVFKREVDDLRGDKPDSDTSSTTTPDDTK